MGGINFDSGMLSRAIVLLALGSGALNGAHLATDSGAIQRLRERCQALERKIEEHQKEITELRIEIAQIRKSQ